MIDSAVLFKPRREVTAAWCNQKEAYLSSIGLTVVAGRYTKDQVTFQAVRTAEG